jgi:hypothetical protein
LPLLTMLLRGGLPLRSGLLWPLAKRLLRQLRELLLRLLRKRLLGQLRELLLGLLGELLLRLLHERLLRLLGELLLGLLGELLMRLLHERLLRLLCRGLLRRLSKPLRWLSEWLRLLSERLRCLSGRVLVNRIARRQPLAPGSGGVATPWSMDLVINALLELHARLRLRALGHSVSNSCTIVVWVPVHRRLVVLPIVGAIRGSELQAIPRRTILGVVGVLILKDRRYLQWLAAV